MSTLRFAQARVLLWATDPAGARWEVSKVVKGLQARCATAPRCPESEMIYTSPPPSCPYSYDTKDACIHARNQSALELALFRPGELDLVRRMLANTGHAVEEEAVDSTAEPQRVLRAHALGSYLAPSDLRVLVVPPAGQIVLVRAQRQVP